MNHKRLERDISREIESFYQDYPFPNLPIKNKKDLQETGLYNLIYFLTKDFLIKQKIRILDVGCGTGELMLAIKQPNMIIDAIDRNPKSIAIANKRAKKFKSKINYKVLDFVTERLPQKQYDIVYSIGVLHHTAEPEKNFAKLTQAVKPCGLICVGIYNPYGEFKMRLKRGVVRLLTGTGVQRRAKLGQKLFDRKDREPTENEWALIADAYANPYRKYYSFNQLLKWFKENDIEYLSCTPPIRIRQYLDLIKETIRTRNPVKAWQNTLNKNYQGDWELHPFLTFLVQLSWVPLGRGELINIVGRRRT